MSGNPLEQIRGARIAHLIESDGPGGAERTLINLASCLNDSGSWNLAIVPSHGEGWLARELAARGVTVERFALDRPMSPECARGLEATFRRHNIALAHSHEFTMAVYGAWASWRTGVKHVITMQDRKSVV